MHKTNTKKTNVNVNAEPAATPASGQPTPPVYAQIKLALDVHAATIVVSRMVEGAKPQPPQTFTPSEFLKWAEKQCGLAKEVVSCYEAGPTGFWPTGNGQG